MKLAALAAVLAVGAGAGSAATSVAGRPGPSGWTTRAIVTMHGTPLIVGPCRFKRLMNSGMVNYRTRDIMRGDVAAMRARCA